MFQHTPIFSFCRSQRLATVGRHVTTLEVDSSSGDFLTVHVYGDTDGKRVYYPGNPMFRGLYTNNPHTLVRYDVFPPSYPLVCPLIVSFVFMFYRVSSYLILPFVLLSFRSSGIAADMTCCMSVLVS